MCSLFFVPAAVYLPFFCFPSHSQKLTDYFMGKSLRNHGKSSKTLAYTPFYGFVFSTHNKKMCSCCFGFYFLCIPFPAVGEREKKSFLRREREMCKKNKVDKTCGKCCVKKTATTHHCAKNTQILCFSGLTLRMPTLLYHVMVFCILLRNCVDAVTSVCVHT